MQVWFTCGWQVKLCYPLVTQYTRAILSALEVQDRPHSHDGIIMNMHFWKMYSNVWPWPFNLENLISLWPDYMKYLSEFSLKSLQWFRSYQVPNISMVMTSWPLTWPSDLVNVISVMHTWWWLIVIAFIKTPPFIEETKRCNNGLRDRQMHWCTETTQILNASSTIGAVQT